MMAAGLTVLLRLYRLDKVAGIYESVPFFYCIIISYRQQRMSVPTLQVRRLSFSFAFSA